MNFHIETLPSVFFLGLYLSEQPLDVVLKEVSTQVKVPQGAREHREHLHRSMPVMNNRSIPPIRQNFQTCIQLLSAHGLSLLTSLWVAPSETNPSGPCSHGGGAAGTDRSSSSRYPKSERRGCHFGSSYARRYRRDSFAN